ncbi:MAG: hypothetical protein IJX53_04525 [Clostridia bacterium]|nr:hypothetical protein [Clostridia bacterium]
MRYFIGIDSGGTKTDSVLLDETGQILLRDIALGCNGLDHGPETAKNRLKEIVLRLCAAAPGPISAVMGGIARRETYIEQFMIEMRPVLGNAKLKFDDDMVIIMDSVLAGADGCGMVCGTGSSLGVRVGGELKRVIGGRGYLIDARGSGYSIARDGIYYAARAIDGRDEHTILCELFANAFGKELDQAIPDLYEGGRRYIASFAHVVFEGRAMGDRVCCRILEENSLKMAELTWAAERNFSGEFTVVMGGGIFSAYPTYADMVIAKASSRAKMIRTTLPPVYGAAVMAMAEAGLTCGEAFRETFLRDYAASKC